MNLAVLASLVLFAAAQGSSVREVSDATQLAQALRLESAPAASGEHTTLGIHYYRQRDYGLAVSHFEAARELEPQTENVMLIAGLCYKALEDYEAAAEIFAGLITLERLKYRRNLVVKGALSVVDAAVASGREREVDVLEDRLRKLISLGLADPELRSEANRARGRLNAACRGDRH